MTHFKYAFIFPEVEWPFNYYTYSILLYIVLLL